MTIEIPDLVRNALLQAIERGKISEDHAKLIASVSGEFADAIKDTERDQDPPDADRLTKSPA